MKLYYSGEYKSPPMNPLNLPKLTKYINDFSDIFSTEKIESLSQVFIDHENRTTEQVVTVFIPHREGNELLEIGLKVFNENGIGQKNLNNGILLIVATDEKKIRIIVGKGMELKYTEMDCRDIIENHLRPLLNVGKYEELIQKWGEIIQSKDIYIPYVIENEKFNQTKRLGKLILGIVGSYSLAIIIGLYFSEIGAIARGILTTLVGLLIIYGGLYFFKNNISETRGVKVTATIIIVGLGCFFSYFGIQSIHCQFNTSPTCIEWNTPSQFWNTNRDSYGGGDNSYSDYESDYDSSSSYDGDGGSSNGGGYGD